MKKQCETVLHENIILNKYTLQNKLLLLDKLEGALITPDVDLYPNEKLDRTPLFLN